MVAFKLRGAGRTNEAAAAVPATAEVASTTSFKLRRAGRAARAAAAVPATAEAAVGVSSQGESRASRKETPRFFAVKEQSGEAESRLPSFHLSCFE
jgi:hypothetical protein